MRNRSITSPSLSILVEKSCKFIPTLILRGNPFGAFGLGEIGAGLCRAAIDLSQDEASLASLTAAQPCNTASGNLPPSASKESVQSEKPESAADQPVTQVENTGDEGLEAKPPIVEAPVEDVYVPLEPIGCPLIQLQVLDLSNCSIYEALPDSYASFGDGVIACANLSTVHLKDNLLQMQSSNG